MPIGKCVCTFKLQWFPVGSVLGILIMFRHWELRITEVNEQEEEKENINDVMSKVKKYVGLYIFLDNAKLSLNFTSGWDFNEKLNVLINVQLLQSNNNVIFTSASKSFTGRYRMAGRGLSFYNLIKLGVIIVVQLNLIFLFYSRNGNVIIWL